MTNETNTRSSTWLTRGTSQTQQETMITTSFTVKVVVTRGNEQDQATKFVWYEGGGGELPKGIAEVPQEYDLSQNHPNPFNPSTAIKFGLPDASNVTLVIYDLLGREVMTWAQEQDPGFWLLVWDGRNSTGQLVPSGVYIYTLRASSIEREWRFTETRKMLL